MGKSGGGVKTKKGKPKKPHPKHQNSNREETSRAEVLITLPADLKNLDYL